MVIGTACIGIWI